MPCKETALRNAQYAYSKYIEGTEKAYLVQGAINDLSKVYGVAFCSIDCITCAKQALEEDDEGKKHNLMARALKDVISRRCV